MYPLMKDLDIYVQLCIYTCSLIMHACTIQVASKQEKGTTEGYVVRSKSDEHVETHRELPIIRGRGN